MDDAIGIALAGLPAAVRLVEMKSLLRLSLPLIVVNLAHMSMGLVDTAFAGRLGALEQAAAGLGNMLFFAGAILGIGITMGIDPIASQAFGAGRPDEARRAMWQGVYLGFAVTIPIAALIVALSFALEPMGVEPALAHEARGYAFARLPGLAAIFAFIAARVYLQAEKRTRPLLWIALAGSVANAAADWALMPAFGVRGIAWASTAVVFVEIALLAPVLRVGLIRPDGALMRRALRLGLPIGGINVVDVALFSIVGVLMARYGATASAAHQVAMSLASLTFMVPLGISAATSVLVGRAIGAGDPADARRHGLGGIALGGGFMLAMGCLLWAAPEALAHLMAGDAAVAAQSATLLRIAAAFQLFDGVQICACGALRCMGQTRWPFVVGMAAYWGVGLPASLSLAYVAGLGPAGLWWGLTIGLAVTAVALTARFGTRPPAALTPIRAAA